jgi:RND superfamily putative drug exporter
MRLTVRSGPGAGAAAEVSGEGYLIGRDDACDLVLEDESVSRRHATVSILPGGRAILTDLGSHNGTYVNGGRIEGSVELNGGEELAFGNTIVDVGLPRAAVTVVAQTALVLRIESGAERGREIGPAGDDFVIGRDERSDLVLADPTVSGRHVSVAVLPDGTAIVSDLGSRNGTFVDGRQIYEPVLLKGGERLRLGDTVLTVTVPSRRAETLLTELGAWLTVESGRDQGRTVKATGPEFTIGRDEGCDLVLDDVKLSRRHAALRVLGPDRVILTDLGSSNGTFVDGRRVDDPLELASGRRIELGDTRLLIGETTGAETSISQRTLSLAAVAVPSEAFRHERSVSTERLARACARRPWLVVALWVLAVVAGVALAATRLGETLTAEVAVLGEPESKRGEQLIAERLGPEQITEFVVVQSPSLTVDDSRFQTEVESLHRELTALGPDVVAGGAHFYQSRDPSLVSRDRRATLLPIVLAGDFDQAEDSIAKVLEPVRQLDAKQAFDAAVSGEASIAHDFQTLAEEDLKKGESIGLAVAFVVLLVVFGTLVASLLPVVTALFSIAVALGFATLLGQVLDLSIFVTNMIVGMGLALGIDYALFVLTRYREERAAGRDVDEAIATAGATSSRAVLFSGLAVVLALFGMSLVPERTLQSIGIGAIVVGALSVLAALTLLPAFLAILRDNVNRIAVPFVGRTDRTDDPERGFWAVVARGVMRRPVPSLLASVAFLVALAIPAFDLKTGNAGVTALPESRISRLGFEAVQARFATADLNPVVVVVAGRVGDAPLRTAIEELRSGLRQEDVFGPPRVDVRRGRELALISVPLATDAKDPSATAAVRRLRDVHIPQAFAGTDAEVLVTGATAQEIDSLKATDGALPFVLAFVLALSFVLLMVAFRSIVVPAKAVAMNLLSVGAAYGMVVLVFQKGVGADLLGFQQVDRVEAWVPLFLFAVLFGLSMDYHVFLLSRIRELYEETGDNRRAVSEGVGSTARIITGAALIMVAVFTGFTLGELGPLQQLGFGMAVALTLDATVIRSVLVPAGMHLLGARNWYLPRWLRWLPAVEVERRPAAATAPGDDSRPAH